MPVILCMCRIAGIFPIECDSRPSGPESSSRRDFFKCIKHRPQCPHLAVTCFHSVYTSDMRLKMLLSHLMVLLLAVSCYAAPATPTTSPSPLPTLPLSCKTTSSCGIKGAVLPKPTSLSSLQVKSPAACQLACSSNNKCRSFAYNMDAVTG